MQRHSESVFEQGAQRHVAANPGHEVYVFSDCGWCCVDCDAMDPADADWWEITEEYPRD